MSTTTEGTPTLQAYFDKTAEHLRTQGKQAKSGRFCRYITDDGLRCAVGCHIPDGHPGQKWTGVVQSLLNEYPDLRGVAVPAHPDGITLARRLQHAHDDVAHWTLDGFGSNGESELRYIAENFGLIYTAPHSAH